MRGGIGFAEATLIRGMIPNVSGAINEYRNRKAEMDTRNYVNYLENRIQELIKGWDAEATVHDRNVDIANANFASAKRLRAELDQAKKQLFTVNMQKKFLSGHLSDATNPARNYFGARQTSLEALGEATKKETKSLIDKGDIKAAKLCAAKGNLALLFSAECALQSQYQSPQLLRLSEGVFRDVAKDAHDKMAEWDELADIFGRHADAGLNDKPLGVPMSVLEKSLYVDSVIPDPSKIPDNGLLSVLPKSFRDRYGALIDDSLPTRVIQDNAFDLVKGEMFSTVTKRDEYLSLKLKETYAKKKKTEDKPIASLGL